MDARSLLRAKKAGARIEHPYASYTARGELKCSVCAVPVKQWEAHLLTKQHRTSVAREKADEAARAAKAAKRAAPASAPGTSEAVEPDAKRAKISSNGPALPAGFFSKGNERTFDDDEEGEEAEEAGEQPEAGINLEIPAKTGDAELDDFFASLAAPEAASPAIDSAYSIARPAPTVAKGKRTTYKEAAPGQASYEAAPVRNIAPTDDEQDKEPTPEPEETPAQRRERLAREEREEIMARLEEEERAQEDADSRVAMLKQRREALMRKRAARTGATGAAGKPKPKANGGEAGIEANGSGAA